MSEIIKDIYAEVMKFYQDSDVRNKLYEIVEFDDELDYMKGEVGENLRYGNLCNARQYLASASLDALHLSPAPLYLIKKDSLFNGISEDAFTILYANAIAEFFEREEHKHYILNHGGDDLSVYEEYMEMHSYHDDLALLNNIINYYVQIKEESKVKTK